MRREIGSWLASPSLLDVQSQRKKAAAQADTNPRKSFLMRHRYLPEEPEDWRRPQQAAAPPVSLIAASLCQELLWTRFTQSGRKRPPSLPLSGMWCCGMVSVHRTAGPGLPVWCADNDAKCQTRHRHPHWPRPRHLPHTCSRRTAPGHVQKTTIMHVHSSIRCCDI